MKKVQRMSNGKHYEYELKMIYVDPETHTKLKVHAASNNKSMKDLIRDLAKDI